jgi:hypothetical protein
MSAPHVQHQPGPDAPQSSLLRAALWVAIGALIAAAIVSVVWVLLGSQNGIVGRAFLTILLLVAFAGVAILDAHLAPRRPAWFALASMIGWVALLLIGAVMIWLPDRYSFGGFTRFIQFLVIVLVVQLALLHIRLFLRAAGRYITTFTRIVAIVTVVLVVTLAVLLILPLMLSDYVWFSDLYWRFVVATSILAAVGTALIPLVNALFAPKRPHPAAPAVPYAPAPVAQAWPTYVDGLTPLPVLPDGSPDWNAYYTGYPSPGAQVVAYPDAAPAVAAPASEAPSEAPTPPVAPGAPADGSAPAGYDGYPPPPPLPPRP